MPELTKSEELFEQLCSENSIEFSKLDADSASEEKMPDYEIRIGNHSILVEVKQLDPNPEDIRFQKQLEERGQTDVRGQIPGKRIRKKISDAMPQLSIAAERKIPAILAIYCNIAIEARLVDPHDVLTAMYGEEVAKIGLPSDLRRKPYPLGTYFGKGRKVSSAYNTTLSAIVALHQSWDTKIVTGSFYHNIHAHRPIEPNLIRSGTIRHYSLPGDTDGTYQEWAEV